MELERISQYRKDLDNSRVVCKLSNGAELTEKEIEVIDSLCPIYDFIEKQAEYKLSSDNLRKSKPLINDIDIIKEKLLKEEVYMKIMRYI